MARDGTVTVKITGDARGLKDALDDSDGHLGKFGGKMGGVAAGVGKAFVGIGAAAGAFGVLSGKAFAEAEQVAAQTGAVIKSTGGIANVTAKDVDTLSGSLSAMSGVDDEAIASGQNLLLTFTKVRNEVGEGNDIFNQATKAALDMSVAMGTDMSSASLMMGKALNDPVKGMTALTRSGVSFTQAQKDQVKAMVKAGDTMGAQKLILKEMEIQFGGSAKAAGDTFAGQLNKLKVAAGNLMEDVGSKLVPVIITLAEKFVSVKAFAEKVMEVFREKGLGGAIDFLKDKFGEVWPKIKEKLGEIIEGIVKWIGENAPKIAEQMVAWAKAFVEWVGPMIPPALIELGKFLGGVLGWVVTEGIPKLVDALLKMGAALIEWIGPAIPPMLLALGGLLVKLGSWILTDALPTLALKLGGWSGAFLGWIGEAILKLPGKLGEFAGVLIGWIGGLPAKIATAAAGLFDGVKDAFRAAVNWIIGKWNDLRLTVGGNTFDLPGPLGKITIPSMTLDTPNIPYLHAGGVVPGRAGSDVLAMLQAGERVLPAGGGGGGGGVTNVFNVTVNGALDSTAVGRQIIDLLKAEIRRSGPVGVS